MPWVRLDEEFPDHPKVVTAGPLAGWLHVCALAYCNRHLTDGFVPRAQVGRLVNWTGILDVEARDASSDVSDVPDVDPYVLANRLVGLGIWEQRQGGFAIHDFLDYQPSRAEIEAQRKVKKDAGRAGGIRSGESRRSRIEAESKQPPKQKGSREPTKTEAEQQAETQAEGQAKPKPDPDPDPDPQSSSSVLKHQVGAPAVVDDDENSRMSKARSLVADRRIDALASPPANRRAYRSTVLRDVDADHGDELRRLAAEGLSAEAIADAVCPAPGLAVSPHQAWQPPPAEEPETDAEQRKARLAELRGRASA